MITPRPYQEDAIKGVFSYFEHCHGNPLVILPTAAGKSIVIAEIARRACTEYPETRVLIVSHVKELLQQNGEKVLAVWPMADLGFYSAGIGRKDTEHQVLVCGIQSVYKHADRIGGADLILVDECHLIPTDSATMYQRFLSDCRAINHHTKVIGLTATPFRMKEGDLTRGEGKLFDGIAYSADMLQLIKDGYLSRLVGRNGAVRPDLSKLHIRGGEFVESEMEEAFNPITKSAVAEILALAHDRKTILAFCSGVRHAQAVAEAFRATGENRVCTISGETPRQEREGLVAKIKAGAIRVVTNCNVLTTGFDAPGIDCIAFLRGTCSAGLYVQMMGRGMRLAEGKANCLVLDYAGNIERHGPVDRVRGSERKKKDGEAGECPVKECPDCHALIHTSIMVCPECGHQFPPREPKVARTASEMPAMSDEKQLKTVPVSDMKIYRHEKVGKPASMRVDYLDKIGKRISEWVCFDHDGLARRKAEAWAIKRGFPPPRNTALALTIAWPRPKELLVDFSGKFPEIVATKLPTKEEMAEAFLNEISAEEPADEVPF